MKTGITILTFAIRLRRMDKLPKLILMVMRLGGDLLFISAADCRITLSIKAHSKNAHMFEPQLARIVDVLDIIKLGG